MDDLSFLEQLQSGDYGCNNATLKVVLPNGQVDHISNRISPYRLFDNCPLLYHAFEFGFQSRLYASIEAPSRTAAIALLRYCYTNNYLPPDAEYMPLLFLPHAQVYKLAEDFDIPELQLIAHGNFSCQVEFACSLPEPPHDLHETIRYIYIYFASPESRQQQGLLHTLLNYCISIFQYHKLGESAEFLEVVRQIPEFRQDLCRTNMARNFQDDCALEIVRLALDTLHPQPTIRPTLLASRDLPQEMLVDRPPSPPRPAAFDPVHDAAKTSHIEGYSHDEDNSGDSAVAPLTQSGPSTLAYRPKDPGPESIREGFETDSSSEDDGFMMVHQSKPKPRVIPVLPEILSFRPARPASPPQRSHALEDYQMQLMLLEQQNKKRLLDARRVQAEMATNKSGDMHSQEFMNNLRNVSSQKAMVHQPHATPELLPTSSSRMSSPVAIGQESLPPGWTLQDYSFQLMLLERENKRRLAAQKAQDQMAAERPGDMSSPEIIPSNPDKEHGDALVAAGSDYSDDEDWTML